MKRYETELSVFNNGVYEKLEWRLVYGDLIGAQIYSYQFSGGNVVFYDTRMVLDDYFEQIEIEIFFFGKMDNIC